MIEKKAVAKEFNKNEKKRKRNPSWTGTAACVRKVFWVRSREEKQRNGAMAACLPQPA